MKELIKSDTFIKWFDKLKDVKGKIIIDKHITYLQDGYAKDNKAIVNGNGIYELRIFYNGYRVYYKEVNNQILLLLCGGNKDSQTRDIEKAKDLLKGYEGY
ncbi:MAG: type II toxin-antitoxin system RelE/ParE family toxin [Spirochaetaceae bacterium]|nr:type II toxin-antitoxin system RelE/ParE family toxin [Spirochaetaceae bacterium]